MNSGSVMRHDGRHLGAVVLLSATLVAFMDIGCFMRHAGDI